MDVSFVSIIEMKWQLLKIKSHLLLIVDLKNAKGIPIASGMYLIHIKSDEGERILKWFGVTRPFDTNGL